MIASPSAAPLPEPVIKHDTNWDATPVLNAKPPRAHIKKKLVNTPRPPQPRRLRRHANLSSLPRSAASTLRALESCLRGTCAGRVHSGLVADRSARSKGTAPVAPAQRQTEQPPKDPGAPLLPCRLPELPALFVQAETAESKGRRQQRRLAD